ncbi:MAG TPA: hypothetical protein VJT13_11435 [Xanthobacteraceae bacterium]|nr:hypothetical protein [Xanthobacteraceae bacterium]
MSSDETPKIESKIEPKIEPVLTITDAPPIVAGLEPAKPEIEPKLEPKVELPKAETLPEAPKLEKIEVKAEPKAEPKIETRTEFPKFDLSASQAPNASAAPKITASATVIPLKKPEPAAAAAPAPQSRNARFALLAACVAIAASFGAVGGSLGVAKFGPMVSSSTVAPAAPIAKEHLAEEVKALKDTVAQLRATTNKLGDNFAALKTSVTAASAQNGKIAEALERIEKSQAEQRKAATAAAAPAVSTTEVTGSIAQKQAAAPAVPMVLGTPPTTLKPPAVPGFVLRRVYDGAALIEGRDGMIEVEPGMVAPGLGRVESIKREDGRWVVVTARGIVR